MHKIIRTDRFIYFVVNGKAECYYERKKPHRLVQTILNESNVLNNPNVGIIEIPEQEWNYQKDLCRARVVDVLPTNVQLNSIMPRLLPEYLGTAPYDKPFYLVVHERSYYNKNKDIIAGCPSCSKLLSELDDFAATANAAGPKLLFLAYNVLFTLQDFIQYFDTLKNFVPALYLYNAENKIFEYVSAANAADIKEKVNAL